MYYMIRLTNFLFIIITGVFQAAP